MKKAFCILLFTFLLSTDTQCQNYTGSVTLAKKVLKDANFFGPCTLDDIQADSITASGSLKFAGLVVNNDTKIQGYVVGVNGSFSGLTITGGFTGKNVYAEKLTIVGSVDVVRLIVNGSSMVNGSLQARQSTFQDLNISADEIYLEDVDINNISVSDRDKKIQTLTLTGKTSVKGNIVFDSGKGIIKQSSSAKILGQVTGATIQK